MAEIYRGIWVIAYRELLRFMQERSRMISSFAMPILFLVIFGAGFNKVIGAMVPGVDFIKFMYPGIVAMNVIMNSMFSGLSIVWDREFGFLREVLVAPMGRSGVVLGKALGGAGVAIAQGIIMLILAPVVGLSLTPGLAAKLIPLLVITSLSLSGMGVLVASRMRSQQGFQILMQVIIFPMMFLSGVFFPVDSVPVWLEALVKINPVTYGVDAIRQLFLGDLLASSSVPLSNSGLTLGVTVFGHTMSIVEDAIVVSLLGVVMLAAAVWSFTTQE
ncbi:MAG: ABC transporter permease [Chloroflexi bacterium]|nr:ABC transporter permease [Chloroflexota bacterium]